MLTLLKDQSDERLVPLIDPSAAAIEALESQAQGGGLVVGQLGQSLDGRVAAHNGESKYINGHDGLRHLHALRAFADAVIIGANTAVADDPKLTVRHVDGNHPTRVLIDPNARVQNNIGLFTDHEAETLVLMGENARNFLPDHVDCERLPATEAGCFSPKLIIEVLKRRGYRRILVEGGPHSLGQFIKAGVLDRLHLIVAPVILGGGTTGIALDHCIGLNDALRPSVTHYGMGSDLLVDCDFSGSSAHLRNCQKVEMTNSNLGVGLS